MHPHDDALERWRLILGKRAERANPAFRLGGQSDQAEGSETDLQRALPAGMSLTELDKALSFVYDGGERFGGTGDSSPYIPQWLEQMRALFHQSTLAMVQRDAFERTGLAELLLQPEIMPQLQPDVQLVATILSLKEQIPDTVKQAARDLIRHVVEQLRRKLEVQVQQAVFGALQRNRYSPIRTARNLDWRRTLRSNLKNYLPERKTIIPERLYFWANEKRFRDWQIIILVDQSGSMANSAVYSSIMACIFASLNVLETNLIVFDTSIVDLTPYLSSDPVELLFNLQLGGGTDIAQAVAYGASHIKNPEKCIFLLITDLYEGGDETALLSHLRALRESKVRVLCLLALEEGKPVYHKPLARQVAALDIPTFAATPDKLLEVMEQLLKGARRA
ncbi:MAG: VWA domain-containing protein [Fimbriimonadales bacterium]|nr:MAG: VWA domain-containing protein [Fimbriimonadales bacterium]